ncbi:hypothetical protein [Fuscibacter oryzae]|uniref:Uncharacterized protein n=1 Tax=Fuscibacter oryzae TaxID=2803939 RepID=A0A8J7MTB0_9RHOB|nr:hypothetical protein [Fuscibacter oryzae]MBL4928013.1 hypothetical protein [Fuscibacter oryzae]
MAQDYIDADPVTTFAFYDGEPGESSSGTVLHRPVSGSVLSGKFTTHGGLITVTCGGAKKTTQLGHLTPITLAELLMAEMARAA